MAYVATGPGVRLRTGTSRAHDDGSFDRMAAAHVQRVRGLCRKLLRCDADADDATQEVMLRAFRAWPRFRDGADPWPWLATIASNVCRDAGRREMRAAPFRAHGDEPEPETADTYAEVERRARDALVRDAIADLPAAYRTALYLRDIEGWSVPEIARFGGRSAAAVRSSLTRARKILASRVEELARGRHQWPLPAAVPAIGFFRSRYSRVKAGLERAAISTNGYADAAVAAVGSGSVRGWSQIAASVVAATVLVTAAGSSGGAGADTDRSPAVVTASAVVAPDAAAGGAQAAPSHATTPATDRPRRTGAATAPVAVAVSEPTVDPGGRTATPGAAAAGGDAGAEPVNSVSVEAGPVAVDCSSPSHHGDVWKTTCALVLVARD